MGKHIGKNISKNLSGKYSARFLDHAKQSATDAYKACKNRNSKIAEATGDLICNKIAIKITKGSKNSRQNNSETVTNKNYKETPKEITKERCVSPEERQRIIDDMRLI